jgi:hypothetical protein
MARAFIWIVAAIFVVAGLTYVVSPASLTGATGISADAAGLTDIRANYGGFQLGFGLFLAWCARSRVSAGLLLTALVLGGVLVSRVIGLWTDGSVTAFHLSALGFETTLTALAVWFYTRSPISSATSGQISP